MKVLVDTNILFSALIFDGNERFLFEKAIASRHTIVITDLIFEEVTYALARKLPKKKLGNALSLLNHIVKSNFIFMKTRGQYASLIKIAKKYINIKDVPILAAGLQAEVGAIVTGDKGFLKNQKLQYLRKKKIFTSREIIPLL